MCWHTSFIFLHRPCGWHLNPSMYPLSLGVNGAMMNYINLYVRVQCASDNPSNCYCNTGSSGNTNDQINNAAVCCTSKGLGKWPSDYCKSQCHHEADKWPRDAVAMDMRWAYKLTYSVIWPSSITYTTHSGDMEVRIDRCTWCVCHRIHLSRSRNANNAMECWYPEVSQHGSNFRSNESSTPFFLHFYFTLHLIAGCCTLDSFIGVRISTLISIH